jgi:uncharacterized membrane protein YciS (DUF1049 family)
MWVIRWFFTLLVLVILLIFSIANLGNNTDISVVPGYLHYTNISVIWIVAVSFIIGMLVSFLIAVVNYVQMTRQIRQKEAEIAELKKELSVMRNLPLGDDAAEKEEKE